MSSFTTRIELHGLHHDHPSYLTLHSEMIKEKFSQTIVATDGSEFHLPPAEYNKIGTYTTDQVLQSAMKAANEIVKDTKFTFSILVTGSSERTWYNLKPIIKRIKSI